LTPVPKEFIGEYPFVFIQYPVPSIPARLAGAARDGGQAASRRRHALELIIKSKKRINVCPLNFYELLIQNYNNADSETRALIPLVKLY
jgi:hypothetical protein